jgi:hypothetical protein
MFNYGTNLDVLQITNLAIGQENNFATIKLWESEIGSRFFVSGMRLHREPQQLKKENHRVHQMCFLCGSLILLCGSRCNLIPENHSRSGINDKEIRKIRGLIFIMNKPFSISCKWLRAETQLWEEQWQE